MSDPIDELRAVRPHADDVDAAASARVRAQFERGTGITTSAATDDGIPTLRRTDGATADEAATLERLDDHRADRRGPRHRRGGARLVWVAAAAALVLLASVITMALRRGGPTEDPTLTPPTTIPVTLPTLIERARALPSPTDPDRVQALAFREKFEVSTAAPATLCRATVPGPAQESIDRTGMLYVGSNGMSPCAGRIGAAQMGSLPTEPNALAADLDGRTQGLPGDVLASRAFAAAMILDAPSAPPATRAALLQVLADAPGVRVLPVDTTHARPFLPVNVTGSAYIVRLEIDLETTQVTAIEVDDRAADGAQLVRRTEIRSGFVEHAGDPLR